MTRLLLQNVPDPPGEIEIDGDEAHYLLKVRRHLLDDEVEVRDTAGRRFVARVARIGKRNAALAIERTLPEAPGAWPVTMLVAVPKGARLDDVVRKLSELGVGRLLPVIAERSNARPGPGRLDRWRRIAAESMRQCGRREPLDVAPITDLAAGLSRCEADHKLILDPGAGDGGLERALADTPVPGGVAIAIGPEGGFTPLELEIASSHGFSAAGLGPTILRVETAAIAAAALAVAALGAFD